MLGKKGIGIGQVFVFIVAAITFALIMIFGYKAITGFLQSGEEVAFVQFKTDIESSVKKIYTEYGSVRVKQFRTPTDYEQVCFVNMDATYDPALCKFDQAACSVWEDAQGYNSVDQNVFLKPIAQVPIKIFKIKIDPTEGKDFLCTPIYDGYFTIVMEGKGDHTEISRGPTVQ